MSPGDLLDLSRTVHGEARDQEFRGKLAVAFVVMNRLADPGWWTREKGDGVPDDTIRAAVRDPWQFSAWNRNDPNRGDMLSLEFDAVVYDAAWRECCCAALMAVHELLPDPSAGATHYYATHIDPPAWVDPETHTVTIGDHAFYRIGRGG